MNKLAQRLACIVLWCAVCLAWPLAAQTPVFINEIHYDNTGTDTGEAIEIAGPAGTNLTGWSIVLYNGTGGAVYDTDPLSGTIPDLGGGFGVVFLSYPSNGIQNGSPDGIALVNASSTVVQFLSYEGSFTAVGGPANGILSTDIGVSENGTEPVGQSLRLSGTGTIYENFIWNSPATANFGFVNNGQTFGGVDQPPSVLSTIPTNGGAGISVDASITINFSEAVNVTGSWFMIGGSSSGSHSATVSGGPQSFIINPNVDFSENETVTVTIFAANVTDQDANDPPDNMMVDHQFSFTTIAVTSSVVINELDSDTPGTDALEFVELYDGGAGNTSLDGLVVVFYNGSNDLSYDSFDLDGFSTDASGYFVLGNAGVANVDLVFAGNTLQNGADAVALYVGNASGFPNGTAVITNNLIDAIVYDTADPDDAGLLVLLNAGQPQVDENFAGNGDSRSSQRIPNGSGGARNTDTYDQFPPTPGTENVGPPPPVMAEIFAIQGTGLTSPLVNQTVITENNIVTALASDGFTMQTPEARVDPDGETSNGIFVFTGSAPAVAVGDLVNVTGQVVEFFNFTEISSSPTVTFVSSGNSLPAPVVLNSSAPSPNQPQPANELERYEGMLVQINGGAVGGSNQSFGTDPIAEIFIVAGSNRAFREPGITFPGLPSLPVWDGNPEVFELDPDRLGLPNQIVPAGSSFDVVGVLGFEFNDYEFWPKQFSFTPATLPRAVRSRNADEVTIGTQNLFRLFDNVNDPGSQDDGAVVSAVEYARRLAKFSLHIRNVLGAPDILAVEEAEKLGVLQALADKIAADDPSIVYTPYLIEGNDIGGIDTGFLVRSSVQVDAVTQLGAAEIFTFDGSLLHDRPPLLLEGSFINGSFLSPITVMAVHNRSLSGIDDPVDGPRVRQKRLEQAQSIAQKVQDLQTANPSVRLVVTGDFNAFQFSDGYVDAVGQIAGSFNPSDNQLSGPDLVSPDLTKQVLSLPAEEQYSFIFDGSAQVLDHMLTSQAVNPTGLQYGRGNADAAEALINDDSTPLRSSDHDGLVMYLKIVPPSVILATNSIWLKQGAEILSGNIVVNNASLGPVLDSQVELSVGQGVTTPAGFDLKAHRVNVKQSATVASDVFYNQLTNNGTITGTFNTPLSLPIFSTLPPFQSAPFGTQDVEVAQGDSIALPAGSYRNIMVRANGKILFTGGIYNVRSVDTRDKTRLLFAASSEVRVSDKFDSDVNAYIGPKSGSGIDASDIIFYVAGINGNNGNLGATPKAAQIGISNTVSANFYVPNGTMWIRQNTIAAGAFLAKDIIVGEGAQLSLDSFFDGSSSALLVARNDEGSGDVEKAFAATAVPLPTTFGLEQNYPNPFNPETEIRFQLPQAGHVVIKIFNMLGREIITLTDRQFEAGYHRIRWNGKDKNGNSLASGVYLYQLRAGGFSQVRKMSLLR